jgi:anaerobic selenocysteine-containing dehydrogenase
MVRPGESGAGNYGRWHSRVSGLPSFGGEIPATVMAEEIQTPGEGQIRGLITMAGNPVLSSPNGQRTDKALEQLDFMVSIDIYINETTRHADLIFPPTSSLEHDNYDIAFHRLSLRNTTRYNAPVFEPPQGALHDWEVLNGLATALAEKQQLPFKPLPEPAALIDLGIQMGFYGEKEGHDLALSLDKIKQHPHGLDLGPLKPSMDNRLCTKDGTIDIAPAAVSANDITDERFYDAVSGNAALNGVSVEVTQAQVN